MPQLRRKLFEMWRKLRSEITIHTTVRKTLIRRDLCRVTTVYFSLLILLSIPLKSGIGAGAYASQPLDTAGYLDFSYGPAVVSSPTGEKPESKLWWNDGFWWGCLWSPSGNAYHIYRLDWVTQTWEDTGVKIDDRSGTKSDVLWDEIAGKLYVVSHIFSEYSSPEENEANWGRIYRYTYDETLQTYSLDDGFPKNVNQDHSETLVIDKDTTGRLWVTYVSKDPQVDPPDHKVFVNTSSDDGITWGTPFALPEASAQVSTDDISSVVAFKDDGGDKIGIMWSNQLTNTLNFAIHDDGNINPEAGWKLQSVPTGTDSIEDHISIKSLKTNSSGQVFAVVKTQPAGSTQALIVMVSRDVDGRFSYHIYSTKSSNNTRPILLLDEAKTSNPQDDKVYVFVTGGESGSAICYKVLQITSPLSAMGDFPPGDCGIPFIKDSFYTNINNATSTKQNVNSDTGLVVLASDDVSGKVYVHNSIENRSTYLPLLMKNP